jgi:transcriptional regulator with XRE-family HTH domain
MSLGALVRAARREQGLTLQELGARAGVTAAHLSNIENGKVSVSRRALDQIAAALGVTSDALLGEGVHQDGSQSVVDRRGRSGAEAYTIEWLARALYEDFISGDPLEESGWRNVSQIVSQYSDAQERTILKGLTGLGLVEASSAKDAFRLRPVANRQNPLVRNCLNLQGYRERFAVDKKRLPLALKEAAELLDALIRSAGRENASVILTVTGLTAAIRDTSFRIDADELLEAGILFADFDRARIQYAAVAAFAVVHQRGMASSDCGEWLETARSLWDGTPSCRKSRHYLCELVSHRIDGLEATGRILRRTVDAAGLHRVPTKLLVPVYASWVLWGHLERRGLLPFTDEGRIKLWAPGIYERLRLAFEGLPDTLHACGAALAEFVEKSGSGGKSCEDPDDDLESYSTSPMQSHTEGNWQRIELLRFPWDEV